MRSVNDQLIQQGNWSFRYRSFLPVLFLIPAFASMQEFSLLFGSSAADGAWEALCVSIGFAGIAVRALTISYAAEGTSGRNSKAQLADSLNTDGMYSIVRNPLYLGNFLMWSAVALATQSILLILVFVLAFTLLYERIILVEEKYLTRKFGAKYVSWAAATPAFFPSFQWRNRPNKINWKKIWRQEYQGVSALILILAVLEFIGDFVVRSALDHIDPSWLMLTSSALLFFLVSRLLVKKTSFLHD